MHFIPEFCIFKASRFSIELADSVQFKIVNTDIHSDYSFRNGMIYITSFGRGQITMTFRTPQFNAGSWFNHFLYVISPSKIHTLLVTDEFDESRFQFVKKSLKNIQFFALAIKTTSATSDIVKIFSEVLPINQFGLHQWFSYSQFSALRPVFSKELESVFIGNNMPLNDLLITCSSKIHIAKSLLTDREINVFLKHWMAGLKPELEYICIEKNRAFNQNTILKGINHEYAPIDRKSKIKKSYGEDMFGGIDIHLSHVSKATIFLDNGFLISTIYIIVHNSNYIFFE